MTERGMKPGESDDDRARGGPLSQEDRERIDRYLARRLSDEEAVAVEERVIRDPDYRAEFELTATLREGLKELDASGELERLLHESAPIWQRPAYALAASVAALLAGTTAFVLYQQLDQARAISSSQLAGGSATEVLPLVRTRGVTGQPDLVWQADAGTAQFELRVDAGVEPATAYALRIDRLGSDAPAPIVILPTVAPTDGEVLVTLNAALLRPGDYAVTLRPHGQGEESVFRLRIQ